MNLYDQLTIEEKETICDWINTYGFSSKKQIVNISKLNFILRFWNNNKNFYYPIFKNNLILSKKVSFEINLNVIETKIKEQILENSQYQEFLKTIEKISQKENLPKIIDEKSLALNHYLGKDFFIYDLNKKKIKIQNNCKIFKVIKKIFKAKNMILPKEFFDLELQNSQILNEKKVNGTLCLSIHPLDFMTMSDNSCNWTSCMSWRFGNYRQAIIEMINSPYILIAYIKSNKNNFILNKDVLWNNKKWRQLFIVTPQIIAPLTAYPYPQQKNNIYTIEALKWIKTLMEENLLGNYLSDIQNIKNASPTQISDGREVTFIFKEKTPFDIITSTIGYITNKTIIPEWETNFLLSGPNECFCCGEDLTKYPDSINIEDLICEQCKEKNLF